MRRFLLYGGMELRESSIIRIREEVVWSWFVCKEKKRLFTYSGHDGRESVVAVDEEEVVIEGECWMRVQETEKDVCWWQINVVI